MSKVNIDGLVDAVLKELKKFNDVTEEEFEKIAKAVAKEGTKKLKATSPKGRGSKKGHYADGWGVTYFRKGNGKFQFVVHNKKKPGLTHLLENGHALNRGSKKGHYADGWGVTYFRKGNGKFQFVVHNKKKPGLTHLLENGHALNIGGRARAIVHIKPVEEWCNEEFERRVEMRLGR